MIVLLDVLFVLVCLMLIFMVVITPSQSEGLAGAFGGVGSESFFGTKAHQHISKFMVFLAVGFLVLAIAINAMVGRQTGGGPTSILEGPGGATPTASPAPTTPK